MNEGVGGNCDGSVFLLLRVGRGDEGGIRWRGRRKRGRLVTRLLLTRPGDHWILRALRFGTQIVK